MGVTRLGGGLYANAGLGRSSDWSVALGLGFGLGSGLDLGRDAGFGLSSDFASSLAGATKGLGDNTAGANLGVTASVTVGAVASGARVAAVVAGAPNAAAIAPLAPADRVSRAGNSITVTGNSFGGVEGSAMTKGNTNPATPRCASADNPVIASRCPKPSCMIASALQESWAR